YCMDAIGRPSIAVGVRDLRHSRTSGIVHPQLLDRQLDVCGTGADEYRIPRSYAIGPLSGIAHYKHWLAERRGFLLHATGIREHQKRSLQQPREREIAERFQQVDVLPALQPLDHR